MQITSRQLKLIHKAKNYIDKLKKKKINLASSTYCYLICWGENLGSSKLRFWDHGYLEIFNFIKIFIKNLFLISKYSTFNLFNYSTNKKNYSKLIVSWCYINHFDQDGSYNDRYFNVNSKSTPNTLWLLISMDDLMPGKIDKNIFILKRKKNSINVFFLINKIFFLIVEKRLSIKKIMHELSFHSFFSKLITKKIEKEFSIYNFNSVLMPYEAQPFQQVLFSYFKNASPNIKTIGYIHNVLPPLPTEYFYRTGSPDQLIIHGENQSKILKEHFLWPKEKIILSKSFGFSTENQNDDYSYVYLPYEMSNYDLAIREFSNFIKNSRKNNYKTLKIKMHPANLNSAKNKKIKKKIELILEQSSEVFSNKLFNEEISVVFGASGLILQSLEKGYKVIQVSSFPVLEVYGLWDDLVIEQISEYIYSYKLTKKSSYINFSKDSKYFNEYFYDY